MALMKRLNGFAIATLLAVGLSTIQNAEAKEKAVDNKEPFLLGELIPMYVSNSSEVVKVGTETLIASYRDLLTRVDDPELVPALLARVAHLELLLQDQLVAEAEDKGDVYLPNYNKAINDYRTILKRFPNLKTNDQVYYQLAKAYDMGGEGENSLEALTTLVSKYPDSRYFVEAQFRRGDYLYGKRRYREAQGAYQAAIKKGETTPFYENALYMNGWTAFKRNFYEPALENFVGVLDRTMPKNGRLEGVENTKRALVDDSLRVMGIIFSYMDGSRTIADTFERLGERKYEGLLYEQLGDLLVKKERYRDAIKTYKDFIALNPDNQYAPALHNKILVTMQRARFYNESFKEKESFINTYDTSSNFYAGSDDVTRAYIQPYLYAYIDEVARFYHTRARKEKDQGAEARVMMRKDYAEALKYYQKFVDNFPDDFNTPEKVYLIADIHADLDNYEDAVKYYEQVAYEYPLNYYSEDAAYSSVVAYDKLVKAKPEGEEREELVKQKLAAQLQLTEKYSFSHYSQPILLDAIDTMYAQKDYPQVITYGQRFLGLQPVPSQEDQANVAIVMGHSYFEQKNYPAAESFYQQALGLIPQSDDRRPDLTDRIAASVYRRAEDLYAEGNKEGAIDEFLRVAEVAPSSQFRKNAEYDAATYLLEVEQWDRALQVLTGYRAKYDPDQSSLDVSAKFLMAYEGLKEFDLAAVELTRVSALSNDPEKKRQALFLSAEYYEKAGQEKRSLDMYKEYLRFYPEPFDLAMETRFKLSEAYKRMNDQQTWRYWLEEMVKYDAAAGANRTDRSKYLAAYSLNIFAKDYLDQFESIKLTLPLNQSLPQKKNALETALAKYQEILDYDVQEFTTQATYYVGSIYATLSRDLIESERPDGLDELALEQYQILLEEEAFPFEEQAIQIHESNVRNSNSGFYDKWVAKSIDALAKLQPGRYNKKEEQGEYSNVIY